MTKNLQAEVERHIREADEGLIEQIRGYREQRREYERTLGAVQNRPVGVIKPVRQEHRV